MGNYSGRISLSAALFLSATLSLTTACNQDSKRTVEGLSVQNNGDSSGGTTSGGSTSGGSSSGSSSSSTSSSSSSSGGGGGTTFTCSLTLALNNGAANMGAAPITANVGDQGNFNVTSNAGSNRYHWFGTKDGVSDLDMVVTTPNFFSGPFQDVAGGHIYTRYVVVESSAGAPLCNTKTANGNQAMTVTVPPGPTCSLTLGLNGGAASKGSPAITANVGDLADFTVATNAAAGTYHLHWYGTKDNVSDTDIVQDNGNLYDGNFLPDAGGHTFTRYIVLEKAGTNAPLCSTKTANGGQPLTVAINAGPTCSLTLASGTLVQSKGNPAISSNIRLWGRFAVNTNASGANIHWHGTKDGVVDMDLVDNNVANYTGPFPDNSAGAYTRYITIEKASNGAILCDSRSSNANQPLRVNVSSAPGCTLAVDKPSIDTSGGSVDVTWSLSSVIAGTLIYFNGTKDGVVDANDAFFDTIPGTSYSTKLTYDSSLVGNYVRQAVLKDVAGGSPVCQTNSVSLAVQ